MLPWSVQEWTILSRKWRTSAQASAVPKNMKIPRTQKHLLIHLFLTIRQSSCLNSDTTGTPNITIQCLSVSIVQQQCEVKGQVCFVNFFFQYFFRINRANLRALPGPMPTWCLLPCGLLLCVLSRQQASH